MSSYGHIRDLKKKNFGIDLDTFQPEYEIPKDKASIVKELKAAASKAENVWLASDEDREGEAISWHLAEVLNLPIQDARRIVFHEITKPAILNAIKNPPRHRHKPGRRTASTPRARPYSGLQTLTRAVAQGKAVALGRTRAERSRETHSGTRTRDTEIQKRIELPRNGRVQHQRQHLPRRAEPPFPNGRQGARIP